MVVAPFPFVDHSKFEAEKTKMLCTQFTNILEEIKNDLWLLWPFFFSVDQIRLLVQYSPIKTKIKFSIPSILENDVMHFGLFFLVVVAVVSVSTILCCCISNFAERTSTFCDLLFIYLFDWTKVDAYNEKIQKRKLFH